MEGEKDTGKGVGRSKSKWYKASFQLLFFIGGQPNKYKPPTRLNSPHGMHNNQAKLNMK